MLISEFNERAAKGLIMLDGATGSNMRLAGMPMGVCTEKWIFDHPEAITALQRAYVDAGSEIVYAPTFSANRLSLKRHRLADQVEALNRGLVAISQKAVDGRALVAGDMTTTGEPMDPLGDLTYEELFEVYREQAAVLADAGVDLFVVETMLGIDETSCAVDAIRSVCALPVMCSLTIEGNGRLLFGGTIVEAVETLQAGGASAVGLNCSVGPDSLEEIVRGMKAVAKVPVIVKPNAGVPVVDAKGEAHYNMDADRFAACIGKLVDCGASIVGGCCGTTPEYIAKLVETLKG